MSLRRVTTNRGRLGKKKLACCQYDARLHQDRLRCGMAPFWPGVMPSPLNPAAGECMHVWHDRPTRQRCLPPVRQLTPVTLVLLSAASKRAKLPFSTSGLSLQVPDSNRSPRLEGAGPCSHGACHGALNCCRISPMAQAGGKREASIQERRLATELALNFHPNKELRSSPLHKHGLVLGYGCMNGTPGKDGTRGWLRARSIVRWQVFGMHYGRCSGQKLQREHLATS